MDLNATYEFRAPVARVWALLQDTTTIAGCLPGCRGLRPAGEDRYDVELALSIAAIAGSFKGTIALQDKNPPASYTLLVEGSGRQGFVKGQAQVTLSPEGEGTRVAIVAHADAGGMIARVGQRLLEGVARTMMDRFFACMAREIEQNG
jgi:uncharacterized protein